MDCEQVVAGLDAFEADQMTSEEHAALARHLEGCASCRSSREELTTLLAAVAALPRSIEPPVDGLLELRARLAREPHRGAAVGRRVALAAGLAAALACALLLRFDRAERPEAAPRPAFGDAGAATMAAARQELVATIEARRTALAPEAQAVIDHNLGILGAAAARLEAAVAEDPTNRELRRLLELNRSSEIDLLRQAGSLSLRTRGV